MDNLAPIVLFTYNRLWHTQQTIASLQKNELASESELFIFLDGAKNDIDIPKITELKNYLKKIIGFKTITLIEREINLGLANSIIAGVTEIVNIYGKIIVLEDDLVTSPYFLLYMNEGLNIYENEDDVYTISGYQYNIKNLPITSFVSFGESYGWATWKRAWGKFETNGNVLMDEMKSKNLLYKFDFNGTYPFARMLQDQIDGKNNSWAIRWCATIFLKNKFMLLPYKSLVQNIGMDESGTHCGETDFFYTTLIDKPIKIKKIKIKENVRLRKAWELYFSGQIVQTKTNPIKKLIKLVLPQKFIIIYRYLKKF